MPVRQKELPTRTCQYGPCGKKFKTANYKRKYCSFECSEDAQGGADRHNGRMEKDPTPEEIAEFCRLIRSGELVIESTQQNQGYRRPRLKPNWVMEKRRK